MSNARVLITLLGIGLLGLSPLESNVSQPSYATLHLSFPVSGYTPIKARIRNAFDHSMAGPYYTTAKVISYTGEEGSIRIDAQGCMARSTKQPFRVNGNYIGIEHGPAALCYDAHPGYDFAAKQGTPITAAASGFVRYPDFYHSISARVHNTLEIEHPGTNCSTLYLHMQDRFFSDGEFVSRDRVIGRAGNIGTSDFYLHFEVQCDGEPVDPYGWDGEGPDPYYMKNTRLWD